MISLYLHIGTGGINNRTASLSYRYQGMGVWAVQCTSRGTESQYRVEPTSDGSHELESKDVELALNSYPRLPQTFDAAACDTVCCALIDPPQNPRAIHSLRFSAQYHQIQH